jgi:hypothetical protein
MRARYYQDAGLLHDDYLDTTVQIQTPFRASNIQSMQAQMMGLFPGSQMNDLNAWEQNNAVPPIDADYSQWQQELGDLALPFGFNTFPIYQYGPENDFTLAVSDLNCPKFKRLWDAQRATIETNW